MFNRFDASQLKIDLIAAAVAVTLGGILAACLVSGVHDDHLKAVMMLSSVVCLTGGLYSVYGAVNMIRPPSAALLARVERTQQREEALKREAFLQAAAKFAQQGETSAMEARMNFSLKSIRDQAEQGLFAASEEERSRYLAAIWSMAACDLDDDADQLSH
jgi:hypothetical protein